MTSPADTREERFRRIGPAELRRRLAADRSPLVLDIRRGAAFREPPGIPGAVPFELDRDPILVPDLARDHPVFTYCL